VLIAGVLPDLSDLPVGEGDGVHPVHVDGRRGIARAAGLDVQLDENLVAGGGATAKQLGSK
jgi:hypothetical protein